MYSVKELADMAGVSRRTLHYYHGIGLLEPEKVDEKGYRWYGGDALLRLQQILLFREMDMELSRIKEIIGEEQFNMREALVKHRALLESRRSRLNRLIETIDRTTDCIKGEKTMEESRIFDGFDRETEDQYAREATDRWGDKARESQEIWKSYSKEKQQAILDEGNRIYGEIAALIDRDPKDGKVQCLMEKWHNHIRYFYEPTPEILSGLGDLYCEDERFRKNLEKFSKGLPEFLREAIRVYTTRF